MNYRLATGFLIVLMFLLPFNPGESTVHPVFSETGTSQFAEQKFALSLVNSVNSQVVTFAVVTVYENKVIRSSYLTIDQFIMQVCGKAASPANPEKRDLLNEKDIRHCYPDFEMYSDKYIGYYCPVIHDLWRIRYKRDPYNANKRKNEGWAKGYYGPSPGQLNYLLNEYGVKNISDYFIGDNMFKLLYDVQDTVWQNKYKSLP